MIFHIPHASTHIPDDVRPQICLSDTALGNELRLMTDWYTDDLFAAAVGPQDNAVKFPVSRLVVDPERFADDALEVMSEVGMGAVYTQTSQGARLRGGLTPQARQSLIETYYQPHHDNLHRAVGRELNSRGRCLIIDCHSFPAQPLPYELEQSSDRPDICLGADDFHSPPNLVAYLNEAFSAQGYRVSVNHPFAGTLVPDKYYWKDKRVSSVMIEINRSRYMDEKTREKKACFVDLQKTLQNVLGKLAQLKTHQQKPARKLKT